VQQTTARGAGGSRLNPVSPRRRMGAREGRRRRGRVAALGASPEGERREPRQRATPGWSLGSGIRVTCRSVGVNRWQQIRREA
jgi:hypothetical protein